MMVYCGLLGAEVYGLDISSQTIEKANKYIDKVEKTAYITTLLIGVGALLHQARL